MKRQRTVQVERMLQTYRKENQQKKPLKKLKKVFSGVGNGKAATLGQA